MKCKSIQKKLALYVSDDLRPVLKIRVEKHLEGCSACRHELQSLKEALLKIKKADLAERSRLPDWDEKSWSKLMKRISAIEPPVKSRPARVFVVQRESAFRLALAAGIIALIVLTGVLVRQGRHQLPSTAVAVKEATFSENRQEKTGTEAEMTAGQPTQSAAEKLTEKLAEAETSAGPAGKIGKIREELLSGKSTAAENPAARPPDRIEMAFVLPESGVQVVWILDRNFSLEGVKNEKR
ncbi:MAG: zf-HC2 domain-containing protein [Candidatus Saccharicenans sp.]|nr:zf-HC2 domain-containing protein [Candidatus Saccharicenans sp.]